MDLTNREKDFKYAATSSLLGVGQFPILLVTLHCALNVKYSGHKNFTVYSKTPMWVETANSTHPIGSATSLLEDRFSKLERFPSQAYYTNHDISKIQMWALLRNMNINLYYIL